ncbi:hypothetical protein BJY24_004390 [Nocardia transvalensis]|uniref:Glycosyl transferase family 2 n=1 Tax=Nocardia transvalensis TaxID=37333 RepID=A0A7W9PGY0_9NOCA|nr:hypothetical protein [Nocardia transvalensis]MBB5915478.1 hypothetical protein [Nocardia transvalensis]
MTSDRTTRLDAPGPDAIVVPAARPGRRAAEHIRLAETLGCALVVFCSREITAGDIAGHCADARVPVVAVDFDRESALPGTPDFRTSELLDGTPFRHATDFSAKRNAAILLSHYAGWDRVFLLDDDTVVAEADHIRTAADLLDEYAVTGLAVDGFPDTSVVGHAYRRIGGPPKKFLSGGALMMAPRRRKSFFPEIYNDEWLYMLDSSGFAALALTGSAIQDVCDPFDDPRRASREEFGEVIALGLHFGIRDGIAPQELDQDRWAAFLSTRHRFLDDVRRTYQARAEADSDRDRILASIESALHTFSLITPSFCVAYVDAWLRDRERWSTFLGTTPGNLSTGDAVMRLGLPAAFAGMS